MKLTKSASRCMRSAAVAVFALIALSFVMNLASTEVSAELVIKIVDGHVYDSAHNPIQGASVAVSSYNGLVLVKTYTTSTDAFGFYTVTLAPEDWNVGYKIEAVATHNSAQVSDFVFANSDFGQTIDLQFPLGIPQFGTMVGFLVAGAVVAGVAVVFLRKKRQ